MGSVRLSAETVERLRRSGDGAAVIDFAVKRYRRGDFQPRLSSKCNTGRGKKKNGGAVLRVYPLRRRYEGISSALLRDILELHFIIEPPESARWSREAERLDREIAAMLGSLPAFFVEGETARDGAV